MNARPGDKQIQQAACCGAPLRKINDECDSLASSFFENFVRIEIFAPKGEPFKP